MPSFQDFINSLDITKGLGGVFDIEEKETPNEIVFKCTFIGTVSGGGAGGSGGAGGGSW